MVTGFFLMILSVNSFGGSKISESADTIKTKKPEAVDLTSFSDGIHHALMGYKDKKAPHKRYSPEEIDKISENLLLWQNTDGGWPKNIDWLKIYYTDLCRERRTGYAWFTYSPSALIKTDFVKWSEKVSKL